MENQEQRATIRDVARVAKVSISTVSRYVNQHGYVGETTAKRIQKAIDTTHYSPSMVAQSLRTQKSAHILLVVPDICKPFYSSIARTVQELVRQKGYMMVLYDSAESTHEEESIMIANQMYASGILLASINIQPKVIRALLQTGLPVVVLNSYQHCPFDTVHVNYHDGSYIATKYLLKIGHRRIGFAGGTPHSNIGNSRREGFLKAMAEAGLLPYEEDMIEIGFTQEDGVLAGQYFRQKETHPTAICCANDLVALGLLSALREWKIRIPSDISVIGMDNIPYGAVSSPALTTITNDSVAFATEGVGLLFDRIQGNYTGKPRNVIIPHELIERESTRAVSFCFDTDVVECLS